MSSQLTGKSRVWAGVVSSVMVVNPLASCKWSTAIVCLLFTVLEVKLEINFDSLGCQLVAGR